MQTAAAGSLGQLLRAARLKSGRSQEELAELAGVSVRNVSDLERGINRSPRAGTLRRIADVLGVDEQERHQLRTLGLTPPAPTPVPGHTPMSVLLKRVRTERGLTQRDLARRALISERAVSDLERGINRTARLQTAELMADALALADERRAEFVRVATGGQAHRPEPAELDPIFGRDRELAAIAALLTEHRLITLSGPGGVGKTRLAVHAAHPGATVVRLADTPVGTELLAALHNELAVEDDSADLADSLTRHLGEVSLLVIDNVEHLAGCASAVGELLRRCPRLRILTTSRVPLRAPGERVEIIRPPSRAACVELFVARVTAAGGSLDGELPMDLVDEVCAILDDLPLAVELAAGWVRLLSLRDILARLAEPLALLQAEDGPGARHGSIQSAVRWSLDLLRPEHAVLFRRLAALPASSTLDMVDTVIGSAEMDALGGLRALVQASIVQVSAVDGHARVRMLRPVHAVAAQLLDEHPAERHDLEFAHSAYVLNLAERAAPELIGHDQVRWFQTLTHEYHHLNAALDRLVQQRSPDAVRLVAALWRFWYANGHYRFGRSRLDDALLIAADHDGRDPLAVATAVYGRAVIAYLCGDVADAQSGAWDAVARHRAIGAAHGECSALNLVAMIQQYRGEDAAARSTYREAIERADTAGADRAGATLRSNLSTVLADDGDIGAAMVMAEDAIDRFQQLGDSRAVADLHTNLGGWAAVAGDPARSQDLLHSAATLYRAVNDRQGNADIERARAEATLMAGRPDAAERHYRAALEISTEIGDRWTLATAYAGLGLVHVLSGRHDDADSRITDAVALADELEYRDGKLRAWVAVATQAQWNGEVATARRAWLAALDLTRPGDILWTLVAATGLAVVDVDAPLLGAAAATPLTLGVLDPWPAQAIRQFAGISADDRGAAAQKSLAVLIATARAR